MAKLTFRIAALFSSALFLSPIQSRADLLTCTFGEGRVRVYYKFTTSLLAVEDTETETKSLHRDINVRIMGPGSFRVFDRDRIWLQVEMDNRGIDGVSDRIYPYSAVFNPTGGGLMVGGCESDLFRAQEPDHS